MSDQKRNESIADLIRMELHHRISSLTPEQIIEMLAGGTRFIEQHVSGPEASYTIKLTFVGHTKRHDDVHNDTFQACGEYLGDNDGTNPQLTCIRRRGHEGDCDNTHA